MIVSKQFSKEYRPNDFDDVVGQEKTIATLRGMLKRKKISPAILFFGAYGTGKTTLARIFAKHICCLDYDEENCVPCGKCKSCSGFGEGNSTENHISVIEINCSESTGIDDIRQLISSSKQKPYGKYRVYILDEVQKLSVSAQNCFLKPLEEPPAQCVFILCTTDPQSLVPTIRSRCATKCEFTEVDYHSIVHYLHRICKKEKVSFEKEVLIKIAKASRGHVRDAVGLLESCVNMHENGETVDYKSINSIIDNSSVANPFKIGIGYLSGIYFGKYSTLSLIVNLDVQGIFVFVTKCLAEMHMEAMYSAINYEALANKTKDFWKFKELNAIVANKVKNMDNQQKENFVACMSDMSKDLISLIEHIKNYSIGFDTKFLLISFTTEQVKKFKSLK